MRPKRPGGREFSKLMPHHVFTDKNRDEFTPVVNRHRVPDKVRGDSGPTRPGLDDLSIVLLIHLVHFFLQMLIYKRPFF